jgi:hypothetical protein
MAVCVVDEVRPMLSVTQLLEKAAEYDRLARNAAKSEKKTRYADIAEYFRHLAAQSKKTTGANPSSASPPTISPLRDVGA